MIETQAAPKTFLPRRNSTPGLLVVFVICTLMAIGLINIAIEMIHSTISQDLPFFPYVFAGMAIFCMLFALRCLYFLRTATSVHIDQEVLRLKGPLLRKSIPWNSIARIRIKDRSLLLLDDCDNMVFYGPAGQKLGVIRDIFNDFPHLLRELEFRSSANRGETTTDPDKDTTDAHAHKRRWHMIRAFAMVALAALLIPVAAFLLNWRLAGQTLASKGRQIDAKMVRHYFVGDQFRLEYEFTLDGLQYHRDVRMERNAWNELTRANTVPVLYAPSHVWINRPAAGELEVSHPHVFEFTVSFIVFCLVISLISLLQYFLVGRSLFRKPVVRLRRL